MYNNQDKSDETKLLSTDVVVHCIDKNVISASSKLWELNKIWICTNKNLKLKPCICVVEIIGLTVNLLNDFS